MRLPARPTPNVHAERYAATAAVEKLADTVNPIPAASALGVSRCPLRRLRTYPSFVALVITIHLHIAIIHPEYMSILVRGAERSHDLPCMVSHAST